MRRSLILEFSPWSETAAAAQRSSRFFAFLTMQIQASTCLYSRRSNISGTLWQQGSLLRIGRQKAHFEAFYMSHTKRNITIIFAANLHHRVNDDCWCYACTKNAEGLLADLIGFVRPFIRPVIKFPPERVKSQLGSVKTYSKLSWLTADLLR